VCCATCARQGAFALYPDGSTRHFPGNKKWDTDSADLADEEKIRVHPSDTQVWQ